MKIKEVFFFTSILLIFGCTTTSVGINVLDGINRKEAKAIAKNETLKLNLNKLLKANPSKIYSSDEIKHSNTKIDSDIYLYDAFDYNGNAKFNNSWYVLFKPKFISASTGFLAVVDKVSGKIMYTKSGNIAETFVPLFEKNVKGHEEYIKAVINYHKENKKWPSKIDEIKDFIDNPNEDINNLTITFKNEQEVRLFHKNALWSYDVKIVENDYVVVFNAPQIKSNEFRDSIGNMLDSIDFKK